MNSLPPGSYAGMTAEEARRRDQMIANLLAHPEDPDNASLAAMVAQGPYRINGGSPNQPSPYMPPAPNYDPLSGGQPAGYTSPPTGYTSPPRGSAEIMNSAPIQAPTINPTNPSARSGLGQAAPSYGQPSAMSNSDYPGSPNYRQPQQQQSPVSINVYTGYPGGREGSYDQNGSYQSAPQFSLSPQQQAARDSVYSGTAQLNPLPSWMTPPNLSSSWMNPPTQPTDMTPWNHPTQSGPTADVLGNYNAPLRPMVPVNPIMGQQAPPSTSSLPRPVTIIGADGNTQNYNSATHQWNNMLPTFGNLSR